jgi:signal transduction histidine kinase
MSDGDITDNIYKYKNKIIKKIYTPINTNPFSIIENKAGELLAAGNNGIYKIVNDSLKPYLIHKSFSEPLVRMFEDIEGNYWITGITKLFYVKEKKVWVVSDLIKERDVIMSDIVFYKNKIIVSTRQNGIYIFEKSKINQITLYDHITKKNGILDNEVTQIYIDKFGNCLTQNDYVGFNYIKSLTEKNKREIFTIDNEYIKSLNIKNIELLYQDVNTGLCRLFVDSSVITFDSTIALDNNKDPFSVVMEDIELFKTKQNWAQKGFKIASNNIPENLALEYTDNYLTFHFQAIDFSYPEKIKYYYKLQNSDSTWIGPISENSATYNNISPGKYIFSVKAVRPNNMESAILNYAFIINPPWWKTLYFRGLLLFVIGASILLYIKQKTYRLEKANKVLNEKVKQRTEDLELSVNENKMLLTIIAHDIKGPLYGISRVMGHLNTNWENQNEVDKRNLVNKLSNSVENLILFTHQILHWLRIKKDNIIETEIIILNEAIKEVIDRQVALNNTNNNKINFETVQEFKVITNKQILSIILNNIIENALKYTYQGSIDITVTSDKEQICLCCSDNGKGMSYDQIIAIKNKLLYGKADMENSFKFGWNILADLIEKNNMNFDIISELNKGTKVLLYFQTLSRKLCKLKNIGV